MSVREEEQKKNCPSRGLGLAAAAIGVGVGAALYYFFNKRNEDPDSEGSTSQDWTCEHQQTLHESRSKMYKSPKNQIVNLLTPEPKNCNNNNINKTPNYNDNNIDNNKTPQSARSYVTISENTTTDTSMIETDLTDASLQNNATILSVITNDSSDHYDSDSDDYYTDDQDEISSDDNELQNDSIYTQSDELNEIDEQSNSGSESYYTDESISTNDDDEFLTDEMSPTSSSYESDSDVSNATNTSFNTTRNLSFDSDSSNTPNNTNNATGNTRNTSKYQMPLIRMNTNESEVDISGWEVTETASGVPEVPELGNGLTTGRPYVLVSGSDGRRSPLERLFRSIKTQFDVRYVDTKTREAERMRQLREQAFRERSWSLEECAICFEIMLKDQPLMSLPCTHNFHVQCIGPWLQDKHTCPVCRKAAE